MRQRLFYHGTAIWMASMPLLLCGFAALGMWRRGAAQAAFEELARDYVGVQLAVLAMIAIVYASVWGLRWRDSRRPADVPRNINRPIPGWVPTSPEIVGSDFESLIKPHPYVAVHFWAPWNGHDPPFDKNIQEVADRFRGQVHFVACNVDKAENEPLWRRCRVSNIPMLAVFRGDKLVHTIMGLREPEQLASEIVAILDRATG